ncbi:hypothetical protein ACM66Z_02445 [Sulfurovum sp. ST-21]|uniref:Uncharacterized protein n=1 Tax=Sulfurovum indicum TaxID=2779528 RepID=A0A7M1S4M5_9BACT|nr:hypothetical protein [Sulfurovum indicum]QOR62353.1 hypothetical protein IMZ28_02435 [Sulfurovum indicum]
MKKLIENLAVTMVVVLFLLVVALVIKYNMIEDKAEKYMEFAIPVEAQTAKKEEQTKSYLQSLESYTDVDVKVDPTKETHKNTVKVTSELAEDELDNALNTDEKKSYLESLESYNDNENNRVKTEKLEDVEPEKTENNDAIGAELDSILGE